MSREDTNKEYDYGDPSVVELGFDHNGKRQWFFSSRDGWEEAGNDDGKLVICKELNPIGTRVELSIPISH